MDLSWENADFKLLIFIHENSIQIENVIVINPKNRNNGHVSKMISDIKLAFPDYKIWVDTWNCTRAILGKDAENGVY